MITSGLAGFFLGGSLIIAIGAQNAYILRMGLLRNHVFWLCLFCSVSDALLILLGILGLGALIKAAPGLLQSITLAGAIFLAVYAIIAAKRALSPQVMEITKKAAPSLASAIAVCASLTFLNPHVYLDTVLLVGAYSTQYEGSFKVSFALGAMIASFAWFFGLGYGARLLEPAFTKPISWKILDSLIALIMALLAITLFISFYNGL